jgi:hypothetical protein
MINLENTKLEAEGFEQILVSGEMNLGDIDSVFLLIVRTELLEGDAQKYDAFVGTNSDGEYIKIFNTDCEFGLDRMTSGDIVSGIVSVDMDTTDESRKQSIVGFCELVDKLMLNG